MITVTKTPRLATAKYLFEAVERYPATEHVGSARSRFWHTGSGGEWDCRQNPLICEEDEAVAVLTRDVQSAKAAATTPNVGTNRRPNARHEQRPVSCDGKHELPLEFGRMWEIKKLERRDPFGLSPRKGRGVCGENTVE
jgi:hypothetical protein